jgi:hypothetical protein
LIERAAERFAGTLAKCKLKIDITVVINLHGYQQPPFSSSLKSTASVESGVGARAEGVQGEYDPQSPPGGGSDAVANDCMAVEGQAAAEVD